MLRVADISLAELGLAEGIEHYFRLAVRFLCLPAGVSQMRADSAVRASRVGIGLHQPDHAAVQWNMVAVDYQNMHQLYPQYTKYADSARQSLSRADQAVSGSDSLFVLQHGVRSTGAGQHLWHMRHVRYAQPRIPAFDPIPTRTCIQWRHPMSPISKPREPAGRTSGPPPDIQGSTDPTPLGELG